MLPATPASVTPDPMHNHLLAARPAAVGSHGQTEDGRTGNRLLLCLLFLETDFLASEQRTQRLKR
jgi:hypothetical protein